MQDLLANRRPAVVTEACAAQYNQAQLSYDGGDGRYRFFGDDDTYQWNEMTSRTLLIRDGLKVLDVGCGYGKIVQKYNNRNAKNFAVGISAYNYGHTRVPQLINGDAHNLHDLLQTKGVKKSFHVVMSKWLMCHLVEPLGTLEQMLNIVNMGGVVVTDRIRLSNCSADIAQQALGSLIDSGQFVYPRSSPNVHSTGNGSFISHLYMRRRSSADEPVRLPVDFEVVDQHGKTNWRYIGYTPANSL